LNKRSKWKIKIKVEGVEGVEGVERVELIVSSDAFQMKRVAFSLKYNKFT
jgi:hypothetical protein